ncbi:MAG TPA: biopolymer transporter ExbD [Marinagarivorans sp.]
MKQSLRAKRMARLHRRHKGQSKLNLVSLMDIFTILVFFLLVNSSDVEVLQSNKAIKLPESVAEKKPDSTLVVMVSPEEIIISGRSIAKVDAVLAEQGDEIAALKKELEYLASRKPFANDVEAKKGRDVTIMGDNTIPYTLLKRIMTTCAQTDYRNISLAVSKIASSDTKEAP